MKRIITIISIALISLLFTACSKSPYDFSSEKVFEASLKVQAQKEGFSEAEAQAILWKLLNEKIGPDIKSGKYKPKGKTNDEKMLNMLKVYLGSKTLKEVKAELEK